MPLEYLNPPTMPNSPVYSQAVIVPANARMLVIGGQNATNAQGEIVGKGDIAAQTAQALDNLMAAMAAAGATPDNLVRLGVYFHKDADIETAIGVWMGRAGGMQNKPIITGFKVAELVHPELLIEIEATAYLP